MAFYLPQANYYEPCFIVIFIYDHGCIWAAAMINKSSFVTFVFRCKFKSIIVYYVAVQVWVCYNSSCIFVQCIYDPYVLYYLMPVQYFALCI